MSESPNEDYISTAAAARLLDVPVRNVRLLIQSGLLGTRKIPGTRARVARSDVETMKSVATRRGTIQSNEETINGPGLHDRPGSDHPPMAPTARGARRPGIR